MSLALYGKCLLRYCYVRVIDVYYCNKGSQLFILILIQSYEREKAAFLLADLSRWYLNLSISVNIL